VRGREKKKKKRGKKVGDEGNKEKKTEKNLHQFDVCTERVYVNSPKHEI
jgi:hypothetical protein